MKKPNRKPPNAAALRRQAETRLRRKAPAAGGRTTDAEAHRLVHELQVHQIELELQNEELVRARADVEHGLRHFTELFDLAPIGYFRLGADSSIRELNLAGAALLGAERARAAGMRLQQFTRLASSSVLSAFLTGVFASETRQECELEVVRQDQSTVIVHLSGTLYPAEQTCLVAAVDITGRRLAEQALRELVLRLHDMLANVNQIALMLDSAGRISFCNEYLLRLTGRKREEVLGKDWFAMFAPAELGLRERFDANLDREAISVHFENSILTRSGERRTIAWNNTVLRDPNGRIIGAASIGEDITDRNRVAAELHASRQELAVLSRQLIATQEEERRRLARELHDEIGQVLTAVYYDLITLKTARDPIAPSRWDDSLAIVNRAVQQVRNLSLDLRPSLLDDLGLAPTVKWYADRLAQRAGLTIHLTAPPSAVELPAEVKIACFRVAQEAMTNVERHAHAKHVWIELFQSEEEVRLCIRDDGVGFDVTAARRRAARGGSLGLLGMKERVELIAGQIAIESARGQGATVQVKFNLREMAEALPELSTSRR